MVCGRCGMPQPVEDVGPFAVFGIPPRHTWEAAEQHATYQDLARRCHPDLFQAHRDERVLQAARGAMRTLNDAHRALKNRVGRLRYALSASGRFQEPTHTVPEGLQGSAQIIGRVLAAVETAVTQGDREAWEAQQDHLASLEVQTDKAEQESNAALGRLFNEWDDAVASSRGEWPRVSEGWYTQAVRWLGERQYLETLTRRVRAGRQWPGS